MANWRGLVPPSRGLLYGHVSDRMLVNHALKESFHLPQKSIVIRTSTSVNLLLCGTNYDVLVQPTQRP